MALSWGIAWAVPALLVGVPAWILAGMIAGAGFSVALGIAESRSGLDQLTPKRVAIWGALGTVGASLVAMPLFLAISGGALKVLPFLAVVGVLGAGSAAGTLAIAKSGSSEALREGSSRPLLPDE